MTTLQLLCKVNNSVSTCQAYFIYHLTKTPNHYWLYHILCFKQVSDSEEMLLNVAVSIQLWMETQLMSLFFFLQSTCSDSPSLSTFQRTFSFCCPSPFYLISADFLFSCFVFCSVCLPILNFSCNNTFSVCILHITKPAFPMFLPFFPHFLCSPSFPPSHSLSALLSLLPSLSPFDLRCLFSPAVFSLIWSVSLQGCNTSMLSPNMSWRSLRTFHHSTFPEQSMLSGVLMCPRSPSPLPNLHHISTIQPLSCWQGYHIYWVPQKDFFCSLGFSTFMENPTDNGHQSINQFYL